ncbi:MAG: hypothetical protein LBI17_02325 [Rickettsiales bacterium]|jgi:chorismate mutase|nr:hypothetical protein [Rickettsiales bacterium]
MEKEMEIMYNRRIMAERKTQPADVAKMEETLDLIDISLYDLLVKRAEIVGRIGAIRPPSILEDMRALAESVRKITSARRYDADALNVAAGIIELAGWRGRNITVATAKGHESAGANPRDFHSLFADISYKTFAKLTDAAAFAGASADAIAMVPAAKTTPKDVWWMPMIATKGKGAKIIGRAPLIGESPESDYIIAQAGDAWNFDRSVVALATSETVAPQWLKSAMHRMDVPLYRAVDSTAIFNGTVLHLVEISRPVAGANDGIFKLDGTAAGVNARFAGYLGGYFLPVVEREKIVEFKK